MEVGHRRTCPRPDRTPTTTSVRGLISPLSRSRRLVECSLARWAAASRGDGILVTVRLQPQAARAAMLF